MLTSEKSSKECLAKTRKLSIYWYALFFLLLFHGINNFFWIKKDSNSGACDVYNHTYLTLLLKRNLSQIIFEDRPFSEDLRSIHRSLQSGEIGWPPLVHTIAAIFCFQSIDGLFCIRFSNLLYFSLLLISVFLTGKRIHSERAGLIAAVLISFYPMVYGMSRKFGLDFPGLAMVSFVILLLIDGNFQSKKFSILFGASLGICMLVKLQTLLFIAGPLLYILLREFRDRKNWLFLKNMILSACIASFMALLWWHRIFSHQAAPEMAFHLLKDPASPQLASSVLGALGRYLVGIYQNISPFFAATFMIAMLGFVRQIRKEGHIILILSSLPAFLIYAFLLPYTNIFSARYLLPAYSSIALITAAGMVEMFNWKGLRIISRAVFLVLLIAGIGQFFLTSYVRTGYPSQWFHSPKTDNHKKIIEKFNATIQGFGLAVSRIGIIENSDFAADPAKGLSLYLMAAEGRKEIHLSCEGNMPSIVRESFLLGAGKLDFVITLSKDGDIADFSGLKELSGPGQELLSKETIDLFNTYKFLQQEILLPERTYVNLFSKY